MPSSLILLPIGPPVARQRRDRAVGPVKSKNHQIRRVILPFLTGRGRKTYAVIFGFIAGVMPSFKRPCAQNLLHEWPTLFVATCGTVNA
tara:strand:- start:1255 stop:1521 length:267 start_codon:yes stop_codon:yes gene_type:complete